MMRNMNSIIVVVVNLGTRGCRTGSAGWSNRLRRDPSAAEDTLRWTAQMTRVLGAVGIMQYAGGRDRTPPDYQEVVMW